MPADPGQHRGPQPSSPGTRVHGEPRGPSAPLSL